MTDVKTVRICMKVCDTFCYTLEDDMGNVLHEQYHDYVPAFMPGLPGSDSSDNYGDYLVLDIDVPTGLIVNWNPRADDLKEAMGKDRE